MARTSARQASCRRWCLLAPAVLAMALVTTLGLLWLHHRVLRPHVIWDVQLEDAGLPEIVCTDDTGIVVALYHGALPDEVCRIGLADGRVLWRYTSDTIDWHLSTHTDGDLVYVALDDRTCLCRWPPHTRPFDGPGRPQLGGFSVPADYSWDFMGSWSPKVQAGYCDPPWLPTWECSGQGAHRAAASCSICET